MRSDGTVPRGGPDAGPGRRGGLRGVLAALVVRGADLLTRALGGSATTGRESITGAQLRDLVAANVVLSGEERRIIGEVLAAGGRHVREVMVPRPDVVFLDGAGSIAAAAARVRTLRHSRYPVVEGSHDDILGVVHVRDLLTCPPSAADGPLSGIAREVKRLPAGKRVVAALAEMRREGHHLAVVVDEYGGTAGIVTLEDLIEELVGEIHDADGPPPVVFPVGSPGEVDGRLNLADFAERTGLRLPAGPYETVGGFLMARLGRLPVVGDEVAVTAEAPAGPPARSGGGRGGRGDGGRGRVDNGGRDGRHGGQARPAWGGPAQAGDPAAGPGGTPWRLVVVALDGRRVDRVAVRRAAAAMPGGGVGHDDPHAAAVPTD
jgi:putative hemolysin